MSRQHKTFFDLPRELRDEIYSYLFISDPWLRSSFHGLSLHLHYGRRCCIDWPITLPQRWLLTNKTFMNEALEEFARNAEWVWRGPVYQPFHCATLPMRANKKEITKLVLYVGYTVDIVFNASRGGHYPLESVCEVADGLRNAGIAIETVRFQTNGNMSPSSDYAAFAVLRRRLDGIVVRRWEFEVLQEDDTEDDLRRTKKSTILYELGPGGNSMTAIDVVHTSDCKKRIPEEEDSWRYPRRIDYDGDPEKIAFTYGGDP